MNEAHVENGGNANCHMVAADFEFDIFKRCEPIVFWSISLLLAKHSFAKIKTEFMNRIFASGKPTCI